VKLSGLAQVRDRLAAARVLQRHGLVDPSRPDEAVRAFLAIRRHGAFGGLLGHAAALHGDAPAITDDRGTVSFRELDETSNALARGLVAKGIRAGAVIAALHRNSRDVMVTISAANKIGVRTVLMNTGFAGPQLADVSARENVSCILVDDEFEDPHRAAAGDPALHQQPAARVDRQSIDGAAACTATAVGNGATDQRNHRYAERCAAQQE
jgi:fatty-acyl-CoA synthase